MSKKKIAGIIVGCIIAIIIIIAIATPGPTHTYTLGVSVSPSGAGSISPSGGKYESGVQVTVTASPASGYTFDYWSGSASGTTSTITITMDSDKSLTANFETIPTVSHDLTIGVIGQGTINPSIGTHKYGNGTQVTITASPASGWKFDHWSGDASGASVTIVIAMDSDKNITAYFEEKPPVPEVVYRITGTASSVDVTLNNPTGGTEQYSNVPLPKEYSYSSFSDDFVYISAQNQGEYGTVTVSIYVDGVLFKTSSSSGAYVIATASGLK
jgi:uncharacterized repeat protein (TIGR02543 family)